MTQREIDYKAKGIIRDRKMNAELALDEFKAELFSRSPRFNELYLIRKQLYFKIGKAKSEVGNESLDNAKVSDLEKELGLVDGEMLKILRELKIPLKSLSPNYYCKKCGDSGVAENKPCICYKRIVESLLNGEQSKAVHFLFEDFDENFFKEDSRRWYKALYTKCEKITNNYPNMKERVLLFVGFAGTGKTHLAGTIATEITARGFFCHSTSAFSLVDAFKAYHFNVKDEGAVVKYNQIMACDLLLIDDLGTEPMLNNITKEYLFNVLNERIAAKKLTIITSNLTAEAIKQKYGDRIFSRIFASNNLKVEFAGADLRLNRLTEV